MEDMNKKIEETFNSIFSLKADEYWNNAKGWYEKHSDGTTPSHLRITTIDDEVIADLSEAETPEKRLEEIQRVGIELAKAGKMVIGAFLIAEAYAGTLDKPKTYDKWSAQKQAEWLAKKVEAEQKTNKRKSVLIMIGEAITHAKINKVAEILPKKKGAGATLKDIDMAHAEVEISIITEFFRAYAPAYAIHHGRVLE